MSDQAPRPRRRDWITPTGLLTAAALAAAGALVEVPVLPTGSWWRLTIMLGLVAVTVAVWELWQRPAPNTTPRIEPSRVEAVRAERERAGEAAAVQMLRTEQPELSLHDAVQLVRKL